MWNVAVLLLPLVCAAVGCGTDEEDRTPREQCRDMVDTYCGKTAECVPSTERADRGLSCEFALGIELDCDRAEGAQNMSACLEAIDAVDCASFDPKTEALPLPDACKGVLVLR